MPLAWRAASRRCLAHWTDWESVGKKSRRAAEQDRPEFKAQRQAWRPEFAAIDPARLVFVDESGASTAMDQAYGRAFSGVRVDGSVPHGRWKITTLTAGVRLDGVPASACLSCHKTAEEARLIGAAGAEVRYLPAYGPDLNPIERLFSWLKAWLGSAKARTVNALIEAIGKGLRAIRVGDSRGWFAPSGYTADSSTITLNEKLL